MATQRWPTSWLFTDERLRDRLEHALAQAVAAGAGILVRNYQSSRDERRKLALQALASGGVIGVAADVGLAREVGADLVHNPASDPSAMPFSLSVHDTEQAMVAALRPAALVFVSPVFSTRSHVGAKVLGLERAAELAALAKHPAYALGGMDAQRGAALMQQGFSGWGGIDCWLRT